MRCEVAAQVLVWNALDGTRLSHRFERRRPRVWLPSSAVARSEAWGKVNHDLAMCGCDLSPLASLPLLSRGGREAKSRQELASQAGGLPQLRFQVGL